MLVNAPADATDVDLCCPCCHLAAAAGSTTAATITTGQSLTHSCSYSHFPSCLFYINQCTYKVFTILSILYFNKTHIKNLPR